MADSGLRPALPYGLPSPGRFGASGAYPGVRTVLCAGLDIVLVQPFSRTAQTVSDRLHAALGAGLPATGRAVATADTSITWAGDGTWLATSPRHGLADRLSHAVGGDAAIIDQSDGRCLFELSGRDSRRTLEKGTTLDLHPRAFAPGQAAATTISHVPVLLRQMDTGPTYEIVVSRSLAADFWHWLRDSAAEYGLELANSDV